MRRLLCVLLSMALAALSCGCELQENAVHALTGDVSTDLESLDMPYIGIVLKSLDGEFYPLVKAGAEAEADRLGVEVIVVAPDSEENAEEQAEIVDIMSNMALDVLAIAPCEEGLLTQSLQNAEKQGKILLAVDENLEYDGCAAYIGSDSLLGGQREGAFAAQMATTDTAIVLYGSENSRNHTDRVSGLEKSLAANDITVLCSQAGSVTRSSAQKQTEQLLKKFDSVGVICATDDDIAIGASRAVRAAGREIPIVSFDGTPEVLRLIQNGEIAGAIVQDAYQMGVSCVDTALALYRGEQAESVSIPMTLVTQRTADYYLSRMEQQIQD